MNSRYKILISILAALVSLNSAIAEQKANTNTIQGPWMTGPLLAPGGTTVPKGHIDIEPYLFVTDDNGIYNNISKVVNAPAATNISPTAMVSYGLTNWMDIGITVPFNFKETQGQRASGVGDSSVVLGFQVLHSKPHSWIPDLRLTLGETFPDGRYRNLDPTKLGVDSIGAGSYQTSLSANFQKMTQFNNGKYLSTRLAFTDVIPSTAHVTGFNSYGGGFGTDGNVHPGNVFTTDLGLEYTLTQHWVPALDVVYTAAQKSTFNGFPGTTTPTSSGLPAMVGAPSGDQVSLAPAVEYNFNSHVGIIAGSWFSVYGRNSEHFVAGVAALNLYF